ncbi:hypothetical protein VTL71DRAFT_13320 [Oculimacula yallundae]|uniref:DUF924-domain-containing protein n=1 Tax=Oculimacula yallundae TaxID=86028 RepID=A0ABR4CMB3_9HELO
MSTFRLNKEIFTPALYAELRNFWFQDLPKDATSAPPPVIKKWFGHFDTQDEKDRYDQSCHQRFHTALESFGPAKYPLPPPSSWEVEVAQAEVIAAPFLADCSASSSNEEYGPNFLGIILLIDQLSRNIFRQEQAQIYNHYDLISRSLVRCILKLTPRADLHASFRFSPVHRMWVYMPLMHSEHVEDQDLFQELMEDFRAEMEGRGDGPAMEYLVLVIEGAKKHAFDVRNFGRFPHRNEYLGRVTTEEERVFMDNGGNGLAPKKAR